MGDKHKRKRYGFKKCEFPHIRLGCTITDCKNQLALPPSLPKKGCSSVVKGRSSYVVSFAHSMATWLHRPARPVELSSAFRWLRHCNVTVNPGSMSYQSFWNPALQSIRGQRSLSLRQMVKASVWNGPPCHRRGVCPCYGLHIE